MRLISMTIVGLTLTAAQAPQQPSIQDRWRSPGGNSIIAIGPCGTSLCGTIVWASEKAKQASRKAVDQLVGAQLLTELQQRPDGRWQGKLFIPDQNLRATAKLELVGAKQLKVSGCLAGKALCKSELWSRLDGPLPSGS